MHPPRRHERPAAFFSTWGIYGKCEACNEQIPLERLHANPSARTCIAHAE